MSAVRVRRDFMVIPTAKRFTVRGRMSERIDGEWYWLGGWHVGTYGTLERAQREADRLNRDHVNELERQS